jgi:cyclopropane fatty-acyl-phospholipid synthase-like methyltransferase
VSDQLQFNSAASQQVEAQYMSPLVAARRQRQRVLALLGLKAGEAVLDIGSSAP